MRGTTSRKCTDEIRTCEGLQAESVQMRLEYEGLQAESVQMRLEHVRDYKQRSARDYKQKCTDEIRTCEGLQAESVQMRLEDVRDYKQKVYR